MESNVTKLEDKFKLKKLEERIKTLEEQQAEMQKIMGLFNMNFISIGKALQVFEQKITALEQAPKTHTMSTIH